MTAEQVSQTFSVTGENLNSSEPRAVPQSELMTERTMVKSLHFGTSNTNLVKILWHKGGRVKAAKYLEIQGRFAMQRGHLINPTIAFETWGTRRKRRQCGANFHRFIPVGHAASSPWTLPQDGGGHDWKWQAFRYQLLLHHLHQLPRQLLGSTGPASDNPETQEPYRLDFPVLTVEDIASSASHVLDHLGVDQLHTVVGASMGGMTALAFALEQPARCKRLVSISSAARALPHAIALRSLQREIIRKDPIWQNGQYDTNGNGPITGMRLARKLGMISYRSGEEWAGVLVVSTQFHRVRYALWH